SPDLLEVVVLAGHAEAALAIDRALVAACLGPRLHFLELDHAGVREEQCLVAGRNQRSARHDLVSALGEKVEEALSDLRRRHPRDRRTVARDRSALPAEGAFRHGLTVTNGQTLARTRRPTCVLGCRGSTATAVPCPGFAIPAWARF